MLDAHKAAALVGLASRSWRSLIDLSDSELLERVTATRDEAAFECLVWRHGPMVLGVCRRVLQDQTEADDAFQATFLVLFRRASAIKSREGVGAWLHGVALRSASKMRTMNARRHAREAKAARPIATPSAESALDASELVDHALARLPDKYRVPLVLCELQGQPIQETAKRLGWAQGTLASRLARGRVLLARQLRLSAGVEVLGSLTVPVLLAVQVQAVLTALHLATSTARRVADAVLQNLWFATMKTLLKGAVVVVSIVVLIGWSIILTEPDPNQYILPTSAFAKPEMVEDFSPELSGRWRVVREERNGQAVSPTLEALVFQSCKCECFDRNGQSVHVMMALPQPDNEEWKRIDFRAVEGVLGAPKLGIFTVRGDTLRLCFRPAEHERPREFTTARDDHAVLLELVREPIAWGPVQDGWQFGLSYAPGAGEVYRASDRIPLHLFLKNTTEQHVDAEVPDCVADDLRIESVDGKRVLKISHTSLRAGKVNTTPHLIMAGHAALIAQPVLALEPAPKALPGVEHRVGEYVLSVSSSVAGFASTKKYHTGKLPFVIAKPEVKLADLPSFRKCSDYRVQPYLQAALALQTLSEPERIAKLKVLAAEDREFKIIPLCRLLFQGRRGSQLCPPDIGEMSLLGQHWWPLAPVEIVAGVPFLVATDIQWAKKPESSASYLQYCLDNGEWQESYTLPSAAERNQALETLLADKRLRKTDTVQARQFLTNQLATPSVEYEMLQGYWRLVREEHNGKTVTPPRAEPLVQFNKRQRLVYPSTTKAKSDPWSQGAEHRQGDIAGAEFRLDLTTSPKRLELRTLNSPDAAPLLGIYEAHADRLRLRCSANESTNPAKEYPTTFATLAGQAGVLWEYERETIVWGTKVTDGLYLGLGVAKTKAKIGTTLSLRVYAYNRSGEPVSFDMPDLGSQYEPTFLDKASQPAKLVMSGVPNSRPEQKWIQCSVKPGAIVELGSQTWQLRTGNGTATNQATALLTPGTYQVKFKGIELRGRALRDTGTVTLEVE